MQVWSFIKSESNTISEEQWIAIFFYFFLKTMCFYKLNRFLFHWHCIYDSRNRHSQIIQMKMQVCFLWKNTKTKQKSFDLFNIFLLTIKVFSFDIFFNRQLQNAFDRSLWDFVSRKWVLSVKMHQMHINIEHNNRLIHF